MSYIPNCRTDENYNEKYLNEKDRAGICGYDWCAEEVVDNFFNNLDVYFGTDDYIIHLLNEELPKDMQDEREYLFRFGDRQPQKRQIKTYGDLLRDNLNDWMEHSRNEIITSMIDNMDEKEYKRIKEQVDGRQSKAEN